MSAHADHPPVEGRDQTLRRLLTIAWSYRADCLQLLSLQLLLVFLTVGVFALTGIAIDYLRHCADPAVAAPHLPFFIPQDTAKTSVVWWLAGGILVSALLRATLAFIFGLISVRFLHGRIVFNLRAQVFAKLQQLSFRFFDSNASGSIINRVTSDAHAVRIFIEGVLLQLAIIVVTLIACSIYMFQTDWRLTLACLTVLPFQAWFAIRFSNKVRPAYEENRDLMDQMVLGFSENVQGIQVVKGFSLEPRIMERFKGWTQAIRSQKRKVFGEVALFWPTIDGLNRLSMAILIGYGGWMVSRGEISLGTGLVAFAGLLQLFSSQVTTLAAVVDNAQVSLAGAKRIFEILDTDPGVASPPGARSPGRFLGKICFENVTFEFKDNNTVLRDISFVAQPGQRIAIAGATGAGKSALLSLIPRFYDPRSGMTSAPYLWPNYAAKWAWFFRKTFSSRIPSPPISPLAIPMPVRNGSNARRVLPERMLSSSPYRKATKPTWAKAASISRAANANASQSPVPCYSNPRSCCWMTRPRPSIPKPKRKSWRRWSPPWKAVPPLSSPIA